MVATKRVKRSTLCLPALTLRLLLAAGCGALVSHARAETWHITPEIRLVETWSDNIGLAQSGGRGSDFVTEIVPSISIAGKGPRLQGNASLQLQNYLYADHSDNDRTAIRLQANGLLEAVDNLLFVEGRASSSEERVSMFGTGGSDQNISDNRSRVSSFSVSPYMAMRFGKEGTGQLRYTLNVNDSASTALGQVVTQDWLLSLRNGSAWGRLGWAFDASTSNADYASAEDVRSQQARGSLLYSITPQFIARISTGYDHNDFAAGGQDGGATYGAGFDWTLSQRTSVNAFVEKRFFGTGYNYSIKHRRARTNFVVSYTKDITKTSDTFDALYRDSNAEYEREESVLKAQSRKDAEKSGKPYTEDQLDEYVAGVLAKAGISRYVFNPLTIFSNAYVLQKRLSFQMSVTGIRNVVSFTVERSNRQRIDRRTFTGALNDDFSHFNEVRQSIGRLTWTHRMTPKTNLTSEATYTKARGSGASDENRRETALSVRSDTRLGPRSSGGLSYRHVISRGSSAYKENAVSASFSHRF